MEETLKQVDELKLNAGLTVVNALKLFKTTKERKYRDLAQAIANNLGGIDMELKLELQKEISKHPGQTQGRFGSLTFPTEEEKKVVEKMDEALEGESGKEDGEEKKAVTAADIIQANGSFRKQESQERQEKEVPEVVKEEVQEEEVAEQLVESHDFQNFGMENLEKIFLEVSPDTIKDKYTGADLDKILDALVAHSPEFKKGQNTGKAGKIARITQYFKG